MSITARSEHADAPSARALRGRSSPGTWTSSVAAPVTTWLLVIATPDGSMMKPLPEPTWLSCSPCGDRKVPVAVVRIVAARRGLERVGAAAGGHGRGEPQDRGDEEEPAGAGCAASHRGPPMRREVATHPAGADRALPRLGYSARDSSDK
jgi:hypothetical protein